MSAIGKVDHLTGERNIKPDCVVDYNLKMGAVDKADMINIFVESTQKTTKWYKKIFFYLINAALNCHILHRQLTGEMINEQGIFCNWTYSSHTETINVIRHLL
jgi:hypothetical protein